MFKTGDGKTWEKLKWEMTTGWEELYTCITTNDKTGHDNLVVGNTNGMQIYDLGAANPTTDNLVTLDEVPWKQPGTLICHAGWMYIVENSQNPNDQNGVYSVQLSKIDPSKGKAQFRKSDVIGFLPPFQLIVYKNKVGLVGGRTSQFAMKVDQEIFHYVDTTDGNLKEGDEFHLSDQIDSGRVLVPVVTK